MNWAGRPWVSIANLKLVPNTSSSLNYHMNFYQFGVPLDGIIQYICHICSLAFKTSLSHMRGEPSCADAQHTVQVTPSIRCASHVGYTRDIKRNPWRHTIASYFSLPSHIGGRRGSQRSSILSSPPTKKSPSSLRTVFMMGMQYPQWCHPQPSLYCLLID